MCTNVYLQDEVTAHSIQDLLNLLGESGSSVYHLTTGSPWTLTEAARFGYGGFCLCNVDVGKYLTSKNIEWTQDAWGDFQLKK